MLNNDNNSDKKNIAQLLKQRISYLRFFVYVCVAISVLLTCLVVFWLSSSYTEPLDIFYSTAPQPAKAFLFLSPGEGNYNVGDEFAIDVLVNTAGSNVVATAAYLSFNKDAMKVLSIDVSGSVFDMEAEKEINNKQGKIKITLGKPTPGVKDNAGRVATIRFKALRKTKPFAENVYFDFTKGSSFYSTVILDDKKGTNILNTARGAKIFIN